MKKSNESALIGGIITLNILGLIVAVSYRDVFDVFCYGFTIMGVMVYYLETDR
jgi:hypothetical protein